MVREEEKDTGDAQGAGRLEQSSSPPPLLPLLEEYLLLSWMGYVPSPLVSSPRNEQFISLTYIVRSLVLADKSRAG